MFVLLQDLEISKRLLMVRWVSTILRRSRKISGISTIAYKIKSWRNFESLFGDFDRSSSSVLIQEDKNRIQWSIYYTSKVLYNAEIRYSKAEKMIYALIISSQRLCLYFQAYPIVVLIDQPLKVILYRPDTSGRMTKWKIKFNEFDIQYHLRPSMKA